MTDTTAVLAEALRYWTESPDRCDMHGRETEVAEHLAAALPPTRPESIDVAGYCPMGCGSTLFLGAGGRITCRHIDCPNPSAVDDLLDDRETEHIVEFGETAFTVRHPLRERLGDALMTCRLHQTIADGSGGPPIAPGRYRARASHGAGFQAWAWEHLAAKETDDRG